MNEWDEFGYSSLRIDFERAVQDMVDAIAMRLNPERLPDNWQELLEDDDALSTNH
jgi:hypothetical protein